MVAADPDECMARVRALGLTMHFNQLSGGQFVAEARIARAMAECEAHPTLPILQAFQRALVPPRRPGLERAQRVRKPTNDRA